MVSNIAVSRCLIGCHLLFGGVADFTVGVSTRLEPACPPGGGCGDALIAHVDARIAKATHEKTCELYSVVAALLSYFCVAPDF